MQAFHNDLKIKEKYLSRVRAHALADEIVKGKYWEGGKGCAVGCTIHGSQHKNYEKELGILLTIQLFLQPHPHRRRHPLLPRLLLHSGTKTTTME